MNDFRITYTYGGDTYTEWYTAKNERIALVMLGAELSDFTISELEDVHVVIETN